MIKKISSAFFSMLSTGILVLFVAFAMGYATFIENKFGTPAARILIYNALWFEILLGVLAFNILGSIFQHKLLQRKKWPVFLFHIGFIIILAGGAITRLTGFEGMMHIREGKQTNQILSADRYLSVVGLHNNTPFSQQKKILISPYVRNKFKHRFKINKSTITIQVKEYYTPIIGSFKSQEHEQNALLLHVSNGTNHQEILVSETFDVQINPSYFYHHGDTVQIAFGNVPQEIPFALYLKDFEIKRYPGSNSPSSFKSYVALIDEGTASNQEIFMNNTLKHKGYRFFQSSYDEDEKGTVLSVSYDAFGTYTSYAGYFIMILGMLLTMFSPNSRFRKLIKSSIELGRTKPIVKHTALFALLFLPTLGAYAIPDSIIVDKTHAIEFARLQIQNNKGRIEPVNTIASEVLRKIYGETSFQGLSPAQWYLSVTVDPEKWFDVQMIKVKSEPLKEIIGTKEDYISFNQAYTQTDNQYLLEKHVASAYNKQPGNRAKLDKEVIKLDERLNIFFMVANWEFLTVFPLENDENNKWVDLTQLVRSSDSTYARFATNTLLNYRNSVIKGRQTGDYSSAEQFLKALKNNQKKHSHEIVASKFKTDLEIIYINSNIYKRLTFVYLGIGLFLLILQIISTMGQRSQQNKWFSFAAFVLLLLLFIIHTCALIARWHIAGHAPLTNGYETMLFISWSACLVGIIFSKWSNIVLAITSLLSAMALLVAGMSWMNPQLTNLAPVLDSVWLIIHVAVITHSYAFLGLSALLGLTSLFLTVFQNQSNYKNVSLQQKKLSNIIQIFNIIGLFLLTAGSVLGGIWANESWGRYWGWDPKETWALVTILVYTFVTHMHKIKGLQSTFALNTLSLVAFSSVLMTYFGVNYFLSGLHSYAQGDVSKVPSGVYYALLLVAIIIGIAAYKDHKHKLLVKENNTPI